MNEDECGALDFGCKAGQIASSAVGDAIQNFADAVTEMVGTAVASLGTIWLYIKTPNLTNGSSGSATPVDGTPPPGSEGVVTALGYATWIGLALAAIAVVWLGVLVSASLRRGEGALNVGRLGLVLGGVALVAGAGSLVAGLLPAGPRGAGGATLFIQSGLWWYMAALAVLSVIVAGVRMAWDNRAEPGKDLIKSLFTLLVVAGAGVTFTQLFITASDSFAVWLLQGSLRCDVGSDKACFGKNISALLALGANANTGGSLGAMLVIVLGIVASLASFLQIALMAARSGMLVILAGVLPLAAAATNTEMGQQWFRKFVGWLLAFLLYKPAAAIVYATAFQLVGAKLFNDDDALVSILVGLMLMLLAVLALPALMRLVTPLVSSLAGGAAGGALAAGALAALPTGAAALGRLVGGASGAPGSGGGQPSGASSSSGGAQGGSGAAGPGAPSGANGPGGPSGPAGLGGPGGSGSPGTGRTGASGAGASGGGGTQTAAQAAHGSGAAASGATGGAASGGAAGGAAAAGAAGGPVGVAAAAGAARVAQAGQAAASAAAAAAQDATGEGGRPSGNG